MSLTLFVIVHEMKRTEFSFLFVINSVQGLSQSEVFGTEGVLGYFFASET